MFKNVKLVNKIVGVISFILFGMLLISISSYIGFSKVGSEIEEIAEYQIPLNKVITELEKDILQEEILTYELILSAKDVHGEEFIKIEHEIESLEKETESKIKKCEELAQKAIEHAHEIDIKKKYQSFLDACKVLEKEQYIFAKTLKRFENDLEKGHLENIERDKKILHKELESMDKHAMSLTYKMETLLESSTLQAEKDEHFALRTIELVSLIVLILSLVVGFILVKVINTNLQEFQSGFLGFFRYLNREQSDVMLLKADTTDEFGLMSKVVNENIIKTKQGIEEDRQVINDTITVLSEFEQGDLCQRVNTNTNNPALKELTSLLNQMGGNIESNIDSVLDVLEEYSNSDYMNKVKTNGIKEHLLKLANGVNTLGDAITQILVENKANGLQLEKSSDVLLKNVDILNKNSNTAASSLEETAAALEEMTSNLSGNTQNVVQMAEYASLLTTSASQGESLANETTIAMNDIDSEVTSISDAITVIDQIAFQTNILSLNAAVEAATAGEAGKGFAVVAQEVRNLASRSAEAANEIKRLVENATKKANDGKVIANKMIDGYNGLNENITKTIELISNVENTSKEQLSGIEQINDAVTSLDQQTQQNAMIASQTNGISEQTDSIAKVIVTNANAKEFIGKDTVLSKRENTITKSDDEWKDF